MTDKKRRQKIANYQKWSAIDLAVMVRRLDALDDAEFALLKPHAKQVANSMRQAGVNAMGFTSEDRRLAQKYANKFGGLPWINRYTRYMDLNWRDRVR